MTPSLRATVGQASSKSKNEPIVNILQPSWTLRNDILAPFLPLLFSSTPASHVAAGDRFTEPVLDLIQLLELHRIELLTVR